MQPMSIHPHKQKTSESNNPIMFTLPGTPRALGKHRAFAYVTVVSSQGLDCIKGPYADHIFIPQGSTGSSTSIFFDIK